MRTNFEFVCESNQINDEVYNSCSNYVKNWNLLLEVAAEMKLETHFWVSAYMFFIYLYVWSELSVIDHRVSSVFLLKNLCHAV